MMVLRLGRTCRWATVAALAVPLVSRRASTARVGALMLAAALVGTDVAAQSSGPERMRAELTAALEEYVTAFSQGRADFIADSVYTAPAYFTGSGGVEVRMTRDEVRRRFEDMLAPLPAQGYARSEIRGSDVCILNDSAALVTLRFARVRDDGSVILAGTAIYFYVRTTEGWRVNASIGSATELECG